MFDWNDLRHLLAVARAGTTAAAATSLRVNATTVARRIAALEEALGVVLFEKVQTGYRLTVLGEQLKAVAERVEAEVTAVDHILAAEARGLAGTIRITAPETLAGAVLVSRVAAFRKAFPDVAVEFQADDRTFDLARGEADIALRAGRRPEDPALVARKLVDLGWGVYCGAGYARDHGAPSTPEALKDHVIIGAIGFLATLPGPTWLMRHAPGAMVSHQSNSVSSLIHAALANLGVCTLPCVIADREPGLVRCIAPVDEIRSELWLVTHERLRHVARIRAFMDFIAAHVATLRSEMTGERG